MWGVSNSHVYTYLLKQKEISEPSRQYVDRINKLYDTSSLISGYRVKINSQQNTYLTFYDQPIEIVYVSRVKGAMGIFN